MKLMKIDNRRILNSLIYEALEMIANGSDDKVIESEKVYPRTLDAAFTFISSKHNSSAFSANAREFKVFLYLADRKKSRFSTMLITYGFNDIKVRPIAPHANFIIRLT